MKRFLLPTLLIAAAVATLVYYGYRSRARITNNAYQNSPKINYQDNQKALETTLGAQAQWIADEGVIRFTFERPEIQARIQNFKLEPFMGVESWVAFQQGTKPGIQTMMMGDLVVLEHEIDETLEALLKADLTPSALHTHFSGETPKLYFMHIGGEGDTQKISKGVAQVLNAIKTAKKETYPALPTKNNITNKLIGDIFNVQPLTQNGMVKVVMGRQVHAGCGCLIGKGMGVSSWIVFNGTDNNAFVSGTIVACEDELRATLQTLNSNRINIIGIHNHLIQENPRLIFIRFWAQGNTKNIAQALKKAVDKTTHTSTKKRHCCNHDHA